MTKEISKEICIKCGIKPRYGYKCRLYDELHKKWEETLYLSKELLVQTIKFNPFGTSNCKVTQVEKFYPDFGQPENFIKLFELEILNNTKIDTVSDWLCYLDSWYWDRSSFLKELWGYLTDSENRSFRDEIMQAIREAEWNYD